MVKLVEVMVEMMEQKRKEREKLGPYAMERTAHRWSQRLRPRAEISATDQTFFSIIATASEFRFQYGSQYLE